jgi:hypothetical protein
MNDEELENKYVFSNDEIKIDIERTKEINEKIKKRMYKYRKNIRDLFKKVKVNQKVIENIVF